MDWQVKNSNGTRFLSADQDMWNVELFFFCGFTEVIKSILHKEILIMPIMRQNTDEYNIEVYNKIIFSDINIHYCSQ